MEPTLDEVEKFLRDFKAKLRVFDIAFLNRDKNTQGYLDLDINPNKRLDYINNLTCLDYVEGPKEDNYKPGASPYWVFGKNINNHEVYIKLSMGSKNNRVLCMSFHIAEHPMEYPLKEK